MPTEKPPKKQVSDRRRMQNKQAQKNYRERQKRNLQVLQDIATSTHGFRIGGANKDVQDMEPEVGICTNASSGLDGVYDTPFKPSQMPIVPEEKKIMDSLSEYGPSCSSLPGTDQQTQSLPIPRLPLTLKSLSEDSIVGSLLEQEGFSLDEKTKFQILEKKITLQSILEAGLRALSSETSSMKVSSTSHGNGERCDTNGTQLRTDKILVLQTASTEPAAFLPDVHRNHFRMKQVLYAAACVANAAALGFTFSADACDDVESPFFRNAVTESSAKTACLNEFAGLKPYLRPTATQLMHRHHPYIDVFPFPTFRERVIKLAYVDEPMIDEDDLCNDLQNDGLICWGSSLGGGSAATGSGAPWDIRSWEAQPWFLKKWWILLGGAEGEIYKQTQWWCEMRGERSCYPF